MMERFFFSSEIEQTKTGKVLEKMDEDVVRVFVHVCWRKSHVPYREHTGVYVMTLLHVRVCVCVQVV